MTTPDSPRKGPPFVNLLGYDLAGPKRFTVPGAPDGTPFRIWNAEGTSDSPLFIGSVHGEAGEFTSFQPKTDRARYVIEVDDHGRSRPFRIARNLLQRFTSRLAYQHFIDVRGHTDPKYSPGHITGGGPSRDGGGQTIEAAFEILLYASNPGLFDQWSDELPRRDMPDLIELALWHAEFSHNHYAYQGSAGGYELMIRRFGYEGDPVQSYDYQNLLDQLAAVCAAYGTIPGFKQHLTRSVYGEYRRICLENWERYDRHKEVRYWVQSDKWIDEGRKEFNEQGNAFGQGVIRNLMMWLSESSIGVLGKTTFEWYDIALGGEAQPDKFLSYAKACCEDIIHNWNLEDPWHTWALRNAEHITPQALGLFLLLAPEHTPPGTREKLRAWADQTIRLSDNLWNYRKHSEAEWAHVKSKEIGTIAGLAGSLFLASHVLEDPRLEQLAWSNVGFLFGANPVGKILGAASALRIHNKGLWPGTTFEDYWPDSHPMGTGRLGGCRGSFEGSPINSAFPYQPEKYNNPIEPWYSCEGWAITNRAWMAGIAFSSLGRSSLRVLDPVSGQELAAVHPGQPVTVELQAPVHHETSESTVVGVWSYHGAAGGMHEIVLVETSPGSGLFRREIQAPTLHEGKWSLSYGGWKIGAEVEVTIHSPADGEKRS